MVEWQRVLTTENIEVVGCKVFIFINENISGKLPSRAAA